MDIQWFPGHMAKTKRIIVENINLVDIVIEIIDARIPYSSKNPYLDKILKDRKRILVFNKYDLADKKTTELWNKWYIQKGYNCINCDSKSGAGTAMVEKVAVELMKEKFERLKKKGMKNMPIKLMISGVPNSGKSSLLNRLAKRAAASTADKPGVTRGKQWVKLGSKLLLLDTPGILWPKFDIQQCAKNLALTGAINDNILEKYELCVNLLEIIDSKYPDILSAKFDIPLNSKEYDNAILNVAKKRNFLLRGNEFDIERACNTILDEFRGGKYGRISLEIPEDYSLYE